MKDKFPPFKFSKGDVVISKTISSIHPDLQGQTGVVDFVDGDEVVVCMDNPNHGNTYNQIRFRSGFITPLPSFKFAKNEWVRVIGTHATYGNFTGFVREQIRRDGRRYIVRFQPNHDVEISQKFLHPAPVPLFFTPSFLRGEPVLIDEHKPGVITREAHYNRSGPRKTYHLYRVRTAAGIQTVAPGRLISQYKQGTRTNRGVIINIKRVTHGRTPFEVRGVDNIKMYGPEELSLYHNPLANLKVPPTFLHQCMYDPLWSNRSFGERLFQTKYSTEYQCEFPYKVDYKHYDVSLTNNSHYNVNNLQVGDGVVFNNGKSTGVVVGFIERGSFVVIRQDTDGELTDRATRWVKKVMKEKKNQTELKFKEGDEVKAWYEEQWIKGIISSSIYGKDPESIADSHYHVRFPNNIVVWLHKNQVRAIQEDEKSTATPGFKKGDRVEAVRWIDSNKGHIKWYPGTVITAMGTPATNYNVQFDHVVPPGGSFDEWNVVDGYIRPLNKTKKIDKKETDPTAKPEGSNPMKQLIPNPLKEGELILYGTGHHFNSIEQVPICFDADPDQNKDAKIIGYGDDFFKNEPWAHSVFLFLPDNLNDRILDMSVKNLCEVRKRIGAQFPPQGYSDTGNCRRCSRVKAMPGSKYCYNCRQKEAIKVKRLEDRKARKVRNAPKWRRRRRLLYALILMGGLAYASVDFKTGNLRSWAKNTAQSAGHFLKDLGDQDKQQENISSSMNHRPPHTAEIQK